MSEKTEYTIIMIGSAAGSKARSLLKDDSGACNAGNSGGQASEYSAELLKRYPVRYLNDAEHRISEEIYRTSDYIKRSEFAVGTDISENPKDVCAPVIRMTECGEDGVFGALWRLGEELSTGLEVNLYDIPIDQAVIELCDHEDINPYEADSAGAYLIATDTPGHILKKLEEQGITARIIGYTTAENAKVIKGPTVRYLTRV